MKSYFQPRKFNTKLEVSANFCWKIKKMFLTIKNPSYLKLKVQLHVICLSIIYSMRKPWKVKVLWCSLWLCGPRIPSFLKTEEHFIDHPAGSNAAVYYYPCSILDKLTCYLSWFKNSKLLFGECFNSVLEEENLEADRKVPSLGYVYIKASSFKVLSGSFIRLLRAEM